MMNFFIKIMRDRLQELKSFSNITDEIIVKKDDELVQSKLEVLFKKLDDEILQIELNYKKENLVVCNGLMFKIKSVIDSLDIKSREIQTLSIISKKKLSERATKLIDIQNKIKSFNESYIRRQNKNMGYNSDQELSMVTYILNGKIENATLDVKEKYQEVLNLEASIAELHSMFVDLAIITELNGEKLNIINNNVNEASEFIEGGNIEMNDAVIELKKYRYIQCCLISFIFICIAIIIISVTLTMKKF